VCCQLLCCSQLNSSDYWTRYDAVNSLGSFGRNASQAIPSLKKQLDDKTLLIRLRTAIALFLISNKDAELKRELKAAFSSDDRSDRYEAMKAIVELNRSGGPFVRYALAELRRSPPELAAEAINALQAIGTEEAIAALQATAKSSDWMLRSQALKALEKVRNPDGKGGN